jgi:thiamine biosynthesis lipoprotein
MRASSRLALLSLLIGCGDPPPQVEAKPDAKPTPTISDDAPPREDPLARKANEAEGKGPPVRADGTIYAESELMGTHVSINLWLEPERTSTEAGVAIQAAFDEIARIERLMSEWMPQSELSRFNDAAGGEMMTLSPELFAVLLRSREISERSGGAFDVTFHAVGQLWTFTPGSQPPSAAVVAEKLALVDWRRIELDAATRKGRLATAGMKVGLGAIAKGYAVDRASDLLMARGFHNHIVEGGGDTYVAGTKNGKPWSVGVQDPEHKGVIGVLPSSDIAVVTSGDYERFFEHEGKRYAHILDPKTGAPLLEEDSCKSITAVAGNATDADAYATAIAVLGPERGMALVEEVPDLEAILITRKNEVLVSTGLRSRFVPTR